MTTLGYLFKITSGRYIQKSEASRLFEYSQRIKNTRKNVNKTKQRFYGQ